MQYQWAEDDFELPEGVYPLGLSEPLRGRKYVMYHGTTKATAQLILKNGFQQSAGGMLGRGVYLSRDLQKASRYPIDHPESDKVVIKVQVNVGKVIAINRQYHPRQKTWHDPRYGEVFDTAWVPPNCGMVPSGLEEDCVWDPNRIKILKTIIPRPENVSGVYPLGLSEPLRGRKYVMYHGTTKATAQLILKNGFQQSAGGMLGRGVYLSRDLQKASRYPIDHPESDKVVIKVQVNVGKVIAINRQYHPRQKTWHDPRYGEVFDTAWVPPNCGMVPSGLEEDCVWDPNRIKILKTIIPRPVQSSCGCGGARGYHCERWTHVSSQGAYIKQSELTACTAGGTQRERDPDTNMQYQWAEDDFELPEGVYPLGLSEPLRGRTYVMYHGTTKATAQLILKNGFQQSADGMLGRGVYLSRDLQKASRYPIDHPESDKVVIKVQVNVGKVIAINRQYHPRQKTWHDPRYGEVFDTAWVPPNCGMVPSGLEEDCVWDPNRIKILKTINPHIQSTRPDDPVNNRKYVMYHGTTSRNAQSIQACGFNQSEDGMLGRGVYLSSDLQKASAYPKRHPQSDKIVIKVQVNVGKVICIDYQGHPRQKTWHDSRYGEVFDTAWVPPNCGMVKSGLEEDCVWDPDRIKILKTIKPRPVQSYGGYSARGYQ
ncbi:grass carp reovirus (GCRV)-induced gene 2e [Cebidichthys violaceus]|uniref:grass carp reovirus (GCRV)-induced gene 2e n=1 Tax=Cebidichthys violaceus TaxID=271503 RepID=UPI0035C9C51D